MPMSITNLDCEILPHIIVTDTPDTQEARPPVSAANTTYGSKASLPPLRNTN